MTNAIERNSLAPSALRAQKASKIAPLTSLRFVAALWVVIYHTFPLDESSAPILRGLVQYGFVTVGLFMVLSGFLLTMAYQWFDHPRSIRRFWVARFARIYPVYLLSLLADLPRLLSWRVAKYGFVSAAAATFATFGFQSTLFQTWLPLTVLQGLNSPSWSVSTEAFFYIAFPFLVGPISAIRSPNGQLGVMAGAWIVTIFTSALICAVLVSPPINMEMAIQQHPILRLPEFVAGIALANFYRARRSSERECRRNANIGLTVSLAVFVPLALYAYEACYLALHNGLLIPVYCCFILSIALCGGGLRTFLCFPAFVSLGEASYAIYLAHAPLRAALQAGGLDETIVGWVVYIAMLIGVSVLVYRYVERPLRARIMKIYDNWAKSVDEDAHGRAFVRKVVE